METFWNYVKTFEPARLRAVWVAVLTLATTLGLTVPTDLDGKVTAIIAVLAVLLPLIQGEWTRAAVVPVARYDNDVEVALNTPAPAELPVPGDGADQDEVGG